MQVACMAGTMAHLLVDMDHHMEVRAPDENVSYVRKDSAFACSRVCLHPGHQHMAVTIHDLFSHADHQNKSTTVN